MGTIKIFFFATLRDMAGVRETQLPWKPELTVAAVRKNLLDQYPNLSEALGVALAAVNRDFAFDEDLVPEDAEVAFFPPVSGGSEELPTVIAITPDEVDLNQIVAQITLPSTGAAGIFTGMVRGETERGEKRATQYLEYEAYAPMAESKMRQVAEEIRQRWPNVKGVAVVQRVGRLAPGTPTVLVACTAGHRDEGVFEAARYGIDRLKEIVPVWKKEVGPGTQEWIEGYYQPRRGD